MKVFTFPVSLTDYRHDLACLPNVMAPPDFPTAIPPSFTTEGGTSPHKPVCISASEDSEMSIYSLNFGTLNVNGL